MTTKSPSIEEHRKAGRRIALKPGKIPNNWELIRNIDKALEDFLYSREWIGDLKLSFGKIWSPGCLPIYNFQDRYLLKAVKGPKWQYIAWKKRAKKREKLIPWQDFDFDQLYIMLEQAQDKYGKRKNFQMICEVREIFCAKITAAVFCAFD